MNRLDWDTSWLLVAGVIARRSRCVRYQTGTVIVDRRNRIVATGYIGPAADFIDAAIDLEGCASFCERGRLGPTEETRLSYSDCVSIHSELNALLVCDRRDREGGTIYVTSVPCWTCTKAIANSGLARAVVIDTREEHGYRDPQASLEHLQSCGIVVELVDLTDELTVDVSEEPHDHDQMLAHLIDEWGARGVVLQLLETLTSANALNLLEVVHRDLTNPPITRDEEPQT